MSASALEQGMGDGLSEFSVQACGELIFLLSHIASGLPGGLGGGTDMACPEFLGFKRP